MQFRPIPLVVALALASGGAAAQGAASKQDSQPGSSAASAKAGQAQGMEKLQQSAQRLRESIQAMAQKKPGADRDRAIEKAHEALFETQRAMAALPSGISRSGTAQSASYDESVKKLLNAADSLRDSIIAISQQPAGEKRDRAVEQAQQALWDTRLALVSAYDPGSATRAMGAGAQSTGSAANTASQKNASAPAPRGGSATASPEAAVLVLLPMQLASDEKLANGCWVRFYDGRNFSGSTLTLAGPVEMPRMHPAGSVWRDWESAIVGPKARVATFDNENFKERTARLAPGQRIADLRDKKLGWFDEVHSARVACTG
jgi:hypothetical protein